MLNLDSNTEKKPRDSIWKQNKQSSSTYTHTQTHTKTPTIETTKLVGGIHNIEQDHGDDDDDDDERKKHHHQHCSI